MPNTERPIGVGLFGYGAQYGMIGTARPPCGSRDLVTGDERIEFDDHESSSAAFMVVRRLRDQVTIGFGVERNGDLDLTLSLEDAQRLAQAIQRVAGPTSELQPNAESRALLRQA